MSDVHVFPSFNQEFTTERNIKAVKPNSRYNQETIQVHLLQLKTKNKDVKEQRQSQHLLCLRSCWG